MSDDNIIQLVKLSDDSLVKLSDIPKPGSDEWIKAVLFNLLRSEKYSVDDIEKVIDYIDRKDGFNIFLTRWLGDVIELLATPMETYLEKGRPHLPADLPESSGDIDFSLAMISDLCGYCGKDEKFIDRLTANLNRGQLYTFVYSLSDTTGRVLQEL